MSTTPIDFFAGEHKNRCAVCLRNSELPAFFIQPSSDELFGLVGPKVLGLMTKYPFVRDEFVHVLFSILPTTQVATTGKFGDTADTGNLPLLIWCSQGLW